MASMPLPAKIVLGGAFLCVPAFLLVLAVPRFAQGLRIEPFHRVAENAELQQRLPIETYRAAAVAFGETPADDGNDLADEARVLALSAATDPAALAQSRRLTVQALRAAPSDPRAWIFLCELDARRSPRAAVACLDHAFEIGPYEWFTTGQRMSLVAQEWPYLDERLRDQAVNLILPMWNSQGWTSEFIVKDELYALTFSDNGRQLLRAGFQADREAMRSFNRSVILERMRGQL